MRQNEAAALKRRKGFLSPQKKNESFGNFEAQPNHEVSLVGETFDFLDFQLEKKIPVTAKIARPAYKCLSKETTRIRKSNALFSRSRHKKLPKFCDRFNARRGNCDLKPVVHKK